MGKQALRFGETILAIDPGVTTGIALGSYRGNGTFELLFSAQLDWDDFVGMHKLVKCADWIVIERFALYKSKMLTQVNSEFPSSQWVGAVRFMAWLEGKLDKVVIEPAASRLNVQVLPHDKERVKGPHATDAYMHLRYFTVMRKHNDMEE